MQKQVTKLIWRRHRRLFGMAGGLSLLVALASTLITMHTLHNTDHVTTLVGKSINHWEMYNGGYFSVYSFTLYFLFWIMGLLLMNRDLKDNFNQFLFTSGFSRQRVYWTKLVVGLVATTVIAILTMVLQYGIFWVSLPAHVTFQLAWPGLITSWVCGLANSIGFFAICWFAALIIGQTGALVITAGGFTLSLVGVGAMLANIMAPLTQVQQTWRLAGIWLVAALILFIWGAYLYQNLSLEHNGEYLLFPRLRVPVYLVFVLYVTAINGVNAADGFSAIIAFVLSAAFGYCWLWQAKLGEKWHQWRSNEG